MGAITWGQEGWARDKDLRVIHIKWDVFMVGIARCSRVVFLEKGSGIETAGLYIQDAGPSGPSFGSYVFDKLFQREKYGVLCLFHFKKTKNEARSRH